MLDIVAFEDVISKDVLVVEREDALVILSVVVVVVIGVEVDDISLAISSRTSSKKACVIASRAFHRFS